MFQKEQTSSNTFWHAMMNKGEISNEPRSQANPRDGTDEWMNVFDSFVQPPYHNGHIQPQANHAQTNHAQSNHQQSNRPQPNRPQQMQTHQPPPQVNHEVMVRIEPANHQYPHRQNSGGSIPTNQFQGTVNMCNNSTLNATNATLSNTGNHTTTGTDSIHPAAAFAPPPDQKDSSKDVERSERKRCREKKRRTDVNQQFSDLTALLRRIEQEEDEEVGNKRRLGSSFFSRSGQTNRIELVGRTVAVLSRIHEENRKRRKHISELQESLENAKKESEKAKAVTASTSPAVVKPNADSKEEVMMMVPMMFPADTVPGGTGMPSMPMPMPNPMQFMSQMQQMQQAAAFCQMPMMQQPQTSFPFFPQQQQSATPNQGTQPSSGGNGVGASDIQAQQQQQRNTTPNSDSVNDTSETQQNPTPASKPSSGENSNAGGGTDYAHCA